MGLMIKLGILFFLLILAIILYFVLMTAVLPKLLKIHCSVRMTPDRGLKKYSYPEGRGIAYEAHPRFRKYVQRYILFTENGYKYLKCKLDRSVEQLGYTVVMYDRCNRVIDVIDVTENNVIDAQTKDVTLHPQTSHIALLLNCVNEEYFVHESIMCCRLWKLSLFSLAVSVISFLQIFMMVKLLAKCDDVWFHLALTEEISTISMVVFAVCIGVIAGMFAFLFIRKKGVRWTR